MKKIWQKCDIKSKRWNIPIPYMLKKLLIMQKLLFKIMMLLMLIPMNNWNAHSQNLRPAKSDSMMVHRDQIRTCVKCLQNAPVLDSIIVEQQHRIVIKDSIIQIQATGIQKAESTIVDLDLKLSDAKIDLIDLDRKMNRRVKISAGIGSAIGVFVGWFVHSVIK